MRRPEVDKIPGRVAIVHDWLTGMRGGERVLEIILDLFEDVTIFTLFRDPDRISRRLARTPVETSFLQVFPGIGRYYRALLPLFPRAVESFDLRGFDLALSISHCVAHGAIVPPDVPNLCYNLSPVRYAWDQGPTYFHEILPAPLARILPAFLSGLRRWDVTASHRVDRYIAISRHVARRIERFYRRRAEIVHPPVDTCFWIPAPEVRTEPFYLLVSALVPQKGLKLAIDAFSRTDRQLLVVGRGPLLKPLRRRAPSNVRFLGWLPDRALRSLYQRCRALVFPGEEDFGLVPLEAQACGRPVLAWRRGGALETVIEGETGLFFDRPRAEDLLAGLEALDGANFSPDACRAHAETFDAARFLERFRGCLVGS